MRVVHVIVSEPEGTIGGADVHVLELAAAQQARGAIEPLVLAPRASAEFRRRARHLGVRVVAPRGLGISGLWALGAGIDVLHAHGYDADFWAASLRKAPTWRPAAGVFTAHGFIATTPRTRTLTRLDLAVLRLAADIVIACSADIVQRLHAARVTVPIVEIVNGVRAPEAAAPAAAQSVREAAGAAAGAPLVAFVGRLSEEKRPDTFVRAAALVAAVSPSCRFVLCGEGPQRPAVQALAAQLGLGDQVTLLGFRPDVAPVLQAADLLVNTSDSESTPRMLAEAMRAGLPLVATTVGGVAEIVQDGVTGLLAPPAAPEATAAHILRLLAEPALRSALARAAARRADRELAVERMEARVLEAYDMAIAARGEAISRRRRAAARSTLGGQAA